MDGAVGDKWGLIAALNGVSDKENDQPGELVISQGEGISFLMGCSKNYIMYWGVFTVIIVPYVPRKVCTNRDFFSFDSYSK